MLNKLNILNSWCVGIMKRMAMDTMVANPVRMTTGYVMRRARQVSINLERVQEIAREWVRKKVRPPRWQNFFHLERADDKTFLVYLIILDSLNFCFWNTDKKRKWKFSHERKAHSGYFGLALALKVWFEGHPDKANFEHLSKISLREFCAILQGGAGLLFLKKRWEIVQEVSRVFVKKYGGDPVRFARKARGKFSRLVPQIARELPSFNDAAVYEGKKIWLLKRAQILAGDIWGAFRGRGVGKFSDLDYLTAFPDYKLPQILREWGALRYSAALRRKIKNRVLISAGSKAEVEIRSATVQAVEFLKRALLRHGIALAACRIDWILWNESKRVEPPAPHHLTKTIFY